MKDDVIKVHGKSGGVRGQHHVSVAILSGLKPLMRCRFSIQNQLHFLYHILSYEGESNEKIFKTQKIKSRSKKSSAWVSSTYCVWRLLCAAVGTTSRQHGLEAFTVYGDCIMCSCRHSKSSAWVRSMYSVWRLYCVQL